jgi:hypothetical protein
VQSVPQLTPVGVEVTVPLPVPLFATLRAYVAGGLSAKVAVTLFAASTTRGQGPVPVHAPLQPVNVAPAAGVAERATLVPAAYASLQSVPQSTPGGLEATVPLPVPLLATVTG